MNAITTLTRTNTRGRTPDGAPNPIDVHVGSRIRLRRTMLGMSQERLGDLLGLTFQQVQKYERGANRVGASRLFDMARILDVPVGFFYDDMDDTTAASGPASQTAGTAPLSTGSADIDPMTRRETLELVRAYYRITDTAIRKRVYDLAKTLGDSCSGEG